MKVLIQHNSLHNITKTVTLPKTTHPISIGSWQQRFQAGAAPHITYSLKDI